MVVCLVRIFLHNEVSCLHICWFVATIQRSVALVLIMAYPQSIRKYVYCVSWRRERDSQEDTIEQKADTTKDAIENKAQQANKASMKHLK